MAFIGGEAAKPANHRFTQLDTYWWGGVGTHSLVPTDVY